jgi:hypothetical protein
VSNCPTCGEPAETFCQCPPPRKPESPYGVPATSVCDAPRLAPGAPLAPFEQVQLKNLLNQFNAANYRIRDAFLLEVTPSALSAGRPKVVRLSDTPYSGGRLRG